MNNWVVIVISYWVSAAFACVFTKTDGPMVFAFLATCLTGIGWVITR
jgi:hypothetical protein